MFYSVFVFRFIWSNRRQRCRRKWYGRHQGYGKFCRVIDILDAPPSPSPAVEYVNMLSFNGHDIPRRRSCSVKKQLDRRIGRNCGRSLQSSPSISSQCHCRCCSRSNHHAPKTLANIQVSSQLRVCVQVGSCIQIQRKCARGRHFLVTSQRLSRGECLWTSSRLRALDK